MRSRIGLVLLVLGLVGLPAGVTQLSANASSHISCTAPSYVNQSLSGATPTLLGQPLTRFVNLSDSHILDDEGSPVITGNWTEAILDPLLANGSAQRLQEEYTDEVLDAMIETINECETQLNSPDLEFMIATGDLTDNMTLNETRRYIDNLDGRSGTPTAYEKFCGYITRDSRGQPKAGLPCTDGMQELVKIPTGRLVADTQVPAPDPDDPTYQITATRSARQIAETGVASVAGGSHFVAPGLPPSLRCKHNQPGCDNDRLDIPHYAVFGNHDAAVRGTVTMQQPFQAGAAAYGRYFLESQREFINEFFATKNSPGPVGHGFNHVPASRFNDADDRNDGYYAFDAAGGDVRIVVINTILDGVENELHQDGATNSATSGVVTGNEVSNPVGLEMGGMDQEQFNWLDGELAAADAAATPVLVFSHHPDRSFSERRLGQPANRGKTAVELNELLGRDGVVVAHIAGHTHENIIRSCKPGAGNCTIGGSGAQPNVANGFWRVETASLIDYPQEGRIVEVFEVAPGDYALRLTMIKPDPTDPVADLSKELSEAEAKCTTASLLGGPVVGGPMDPGRLSEILDNAGEAAVMGNFCQGDASLTQAAGAPTDRDTVLYP